MADARDNRRAARRLWVWPVAVLVSFPVGGYLADLVVDGVDSVSAAWRGDSSGASLSERQSGSL